MCTLNQIDTYTDVSRNFSFSTAGLLLDSGERNKGEVTLTETSNAECRNSETRALSSWHLIVITTWVCVWVCVCGGGGGGMRARCSPW